MKSQTVIVYLMNKTATDFLKHDSQTFAGLLLRLNKLKQWNAWMAEFLAREKILTEHCQIVGLDKSSLIVIADNAHWVTRFRFFIPELISKLRNCPGLEKLGSICCKVRPPYYAPVSRGKKYKPTLSAVSAAILRDAASKIKDDKLRKSLEKMADNESILSPRK